MLRSARFTSDGLRVGLTTPDISPPTYMINPAIIGRSILGGPGIVGWTKTSDYAGIYGMSGQGISGFCQNDSRNYGYAGYVEARMTSYLGLALEAIEPAIINAVESHVVRQSTIIGSFVDIDPINMIVDGQTMGVWPASGRQDVNSYPVSCAYGIVPNGAVFRKGIVFAAGSVLCEDDVIADGYGGDYGYYKCILNHTAAAGNKPASGESFLTYWALYAAALAWQNSHYYSVGDNVLGTNNAVYTCILPHTSNSTTRPVTGITGDTWIPYWVAITGIGKTWSSGKLYSAAKFIAIQMANDQRVCWGDEDTYIAGGSDNRIYHCVSGTHMITLAPDVDVDNPVIILVGAYQRKITIDVNGFLKGVTI